MDGGEQTFEPSVPLDLDQSKQTSDGGNEVGRPWTARLYVSHWPSMSVVRYELTKRNSIVRLAQIKCDEVRDMVCPT